jgi:hypothetical protein
VDDKGRWVALASEFNLLYWPGRALYDGHRLRYRVSLYSADLHTRIAVFDGARYPINAVAFHPSESWAAVCTGSYDGGYMFEGGVLLWNWETNETRNLLGESREVVACRFLDEGRKLAILLRPRDEQEYEVEAPFDTYVATTLNDLRDYRDFDLKSGDADPRLEGLEPVDPAAFGFQRPRPVNYDERQSAIGKVFSALPGFEERHRVWDVMWLDHSELAAVHDGCYFERWNTKGQLLDAAAGEGHGVQLLQWRDQPAVHVFRQANWISGVDDLSRLLTLDGTEIRTFDRGYVMSADQLGRLLCRDTGGPRLNPEQKRRRRDLVLNISGDATLDSDLGDYDCFNHFVRIERDDALWFLRGTPPSSHEGKWLCKINPVGAVEEVVPWDTKGQHIMNGCGLRVGDSVVRSASVYNPRPSDAKYNIESLQLDASPFRVMQKQGWCRPTLAPATAMTLVADHVIAYALTDGSLGLLDARTGSALTEEQVMVDGVDTMVLSLHSADGVLAAGTICGSVLLCDLPEALPGRR